METNTRDPRPLVAVDGWLEPAHVLHVDDDGRLHVANRWVDATVPAGHVHEIEAPEMGR